MSRRDVIEVAEAALRAKGKCPACSTKTRSFVCDCAKDCGKWSECMAAIANAAFARHATTETTDHE